MTTSLAVSLAVWLGSLPLTAYYFHLLSPVTLLANLCIVPLDNVRGWYRYHHLFADLLCDRLRQTQPDRLSELHWRARAWYSAQQLSREAIHHALLAQDFDRALDLVGRIAREMIGHNESTALKTWLSAVPENLLLARPDLAMKYVWTLIGVAPQIEAGSWLDRIESASSLPAGVRGEVKAAQRKSGKPGQKGASILALKAHVVVAFTLIWRGKISRIVPRLMFHEFCR